MNILIIFCVLSILSVYLFLAITNQKYSFDNAGRRSGIDRRKSFSAGKNRMRRSGKDRRYTVDRRKQQRMKNGHFFRRK
jgi:hypothetical protein